MKEQNTWIVVAVVVIVALVAGYVGYMIVVNGSLDLQPAPSLPPSSIGGIVTSAGAGSTSVFMAKHGIGEMGWYAQVKDTEGNVIGLWQNLKK